MASRLNAAPYARTFQRYVAQGVALMLRLVQHTPGVLPDDLRVQALHTLSYALHLPEVWPVTRDLLLVLGSGKRVFPEGLPINLQLVESKPFPSGVVLMRYQRNQA